MNTLVQDDDETQRKGLVYLLYNVVGTNEVDEEVRRLIWRGAHVAQSIPMKVRAVHFCFNDTRLRGLASLFIFAAGKEFRARCRLHCGKIYAFIYILLRAISTICIIYLLLLSLYPFQMN